MSGERIDNIVKQTMQAFLMDGNTKAKHKAELLQAAEQDQAKLTNKAALLMWAYVRGMARGCKMGICALLRNICKEGL